MGIRDIFNNRFFEHHWKNKVFIAQVCLITLAFILGIAKVATKPANIPMNRSDIMAITMVCLGLAPYFEVTTHAYTEHKILRIPRLRVFNPESRQV
jgi:membrane-associated HD superfamily phosphohydrolase